MLATEVQAAEASPQVLPLDVTEKLLNLCQEKLQELSS